MVMGSTTTKYLREDPNYVVTKDGPRGAKGDTGPKVWNLQVVQQPPPLRARRYSAVHHKQTTTTIIYRHTAVSQKCRIVVFPTLKTVPVSA